MTRIKRHLTKKRKKFSHKTLWLDFRETSFERFCHLRDKNRYTCITIFIMFNGELVDSWNSPRSRN